MNTTLQTITSPHTGSSKITPPTLNRKWFSKYFKQLALFAVMLTAGVQVVLADPDPYFPSGGDGSENNPFQIKTVNDLVKFGSMALANNAGSSDWESTYRYKSYKLMNDITLTGTNNYTPAGYRTSNTSSGHTYNSFQGVFDGNNCTISGISITNSIQYSGFISALWNGIVKDLTIASSTFKTTYNNSCVGAIAGYIEGSAQIINCKIIDCTIDGNNYVGGIVGGTSSASPAPTIQNCRVGGTTNIKHTNSQYYGAIVGRNLASTGSWSNNYYEWTVTRNGNPMRYNGTGWACNGYNIYGKAEIEPVNSWAALKRAMSVGIVPGSEGVVTLADNVTDPDKTSSSYLTVPEGKTVVLNLNGKRINRGLTSAITNGFVIKNEGTLTINGSGTITGGKNTNAGGGIYDSGTLTINGGSITGNTALKGGGIFEYYRTATVTLNGVSITDNNATDEGGGIEINLTSSSNVTICGGSTISNNSAVNKGGGIYYVEGTLKIKGKVTISGNTKGEDPNNVELYSGKSITIDDNLDPETNIGVYVQNITSLPRNITSGLSGKGVYSYFTSDNSSYAVRPYDDNNAEACLKRIITPTVSMYGWTYGSTASNPSVSGNSGSGAVTYTYKAEGESDFTRTEPPTNAGTHTVKATIAETTGYTAGEATNTYTVAKREVTLSWDNTSLTYNKSAQKPTASVSNKVGTDVCDVTVSGEQTNASDVAYTATASALTGTHSANYKLPTTLPTQTFTIGKKDVIVSGITASDKTYDGNTTATIVATNASFDGLLDGDALSVSTSGTFADANVGTGKTVTFGALTLGGTSVGNYQLKTGEGVQQSSTTADITTKALTITADGKNITYGDEPPTYTVSSDGFVAGESEANLTGTISCACDYAQYNNANTYPITPSGATSTNYAITYTPGTLTVGQKILSVTANPQTITYGEDITSATTDVTTVGLVGSDALNSITLTKTKTDYNASAYANDITPSEAIVKRGETNVTGNYNITYNKGNLTINQKALSITASAQTITYGENISSETTDVSVEGLVTGDALNSITLTKTQTNYSATAYANDITPSAAVVKKSSTDVTGNYNITYNNGDLTINKKTVGLNWSATSFDYDGTAKAPTVEATELVGTDVCTVNVNVPGEHTAVGFYTATATTLSNTNYALPALATQEYQIVRPMTGISFNASQHWNTYCAFEDLATPDGITAYIVTGTNGGKATTSQIDYIPQGVGVLLYGEAGSDLRASAYTGAAGSFTTNKLVGVTSATAIAAEAGYVLYGDAFVLTTGGSLPANRSYLPASGPALTRSIIIEGGDGATSIESIEDHQATDGRWFDMQGRRIDKPKKKGLYILDGKKVVIK